MNGNFLQFSRNMAIGKFYFITNFFLSYHHKKGYVSTQNCFKEIESRIDTFFFIFQRFFHHDWQAVTLHSCHSRFIIGNNLFVEGT